MATGFIRVSRRENGRVPDGSHSLLNLISEATPIIFVILLIRNKSLGLACTQNEGITHNGVNAGRQRPVGSA